MSANSAYFTSRTEVGQQFAAQLAHLRYENTAILALSPGGVVIAIEIAKQLHSIAGLLLLKHVYLPDGKTAIGIVNDQGGFTYDDSIPAAQIEDFEMEYRGMIEDNKMKAMHQLHAIGHVGNLDPHNFTGRTVIVVNDFTRTGTAFHAALDFLKPIKIQKIILATAIAQLKAIDKMHLLGDQILIAHATDKDFPSEHYFANNDIPQSDAIVKMLRQILLQW